MTLFAILLYCAIMSFIAIMSWFAFFIYFKDNAPEVIEEGSGTHWALLVIAIGFGLMIVLAGLGRGIEQTRDKTGAFSVKGEGGFKFQLPEWMRGAAPGSAERMVREKRGEQVEGYRSRLHES